MKELCDIPQFQMWKRIEKIYKGWSNDKKYYAEDENGTKLLVRLSDIQQYEQKKKEFEMIQVFNQFSFPMSRAVSFGVCNQGQNTFMLLSWVEGGSLIDSLPQFAPEKQYQLGIEAGKYLKQIHSIPVKNIPNWEEKMKEKIAARVRQYETSPYRFTGDEAAIHYVKKHLNQVDHVSQVYQHGDYHVGNLLYTTDGKIGVIDFNRWDQGDYAEEFYKIQSFDREVSVPFTIGKLEGYFSGQPPEEFWKRHALYVAYSSLFSVIWSIPFGEESVENMIGRLKVALNDYDQFQTIVPKWYRNGKIN